MKGRLNSAIIALVAINAVATALVLGLAFVAGTRSGGKGLLDVFSLPAAALFPLLGALGVLIIEVLWVRPEL